MAWGEARGLSSNAWIAVTWVVINRWQSGNWDYRNCETVFDVLTQRIGGGVQFSGYSAGYPVTEEIHNAVINAFADFAEGKDDPTGGALFFNGFGNKIVTWTSYEDFNHLDKGQTWK
jgi:spore germination cell wall hydrolase CwlJ-like protein